MQFFDSSETSETLERVPVTQARRRRSVAYLDGDLVATVPYEGNVWAADLSAHVTFSGIPQTDGLILLERNPNLHPFRARGYSWDPGWYHEARNTAQVEGPMEEMVAAVAGTPIRMEFEETPPWLAYAEPSFKRHREWAKRVWYEWNRPSNDWVRIFAEQSMRATPWYGFYLGEIVANEQWDMLSGDRLPRRYWIPTLPRWIAPWSVHRWITLGDTLQGVSLSMSQQIDSYGRAGQAYAALPKEKFIHVAARPMGPNWEGRSHLRSSYNLIRMLRTALQVEALGHETHGIGMTVIEEGANGMTKQVRRNLDDQFLNAKTSHVPYIRVPNGTKVSVQSPQSQLKEMGGATGRLNQGIMLGLGTEGKLIGLTAGSNAARESAAADAWRPFRSVAHSYVVQPLNRLFSKMLRFNFPEDTHFCEPRLVIGGVEKRDGIDIISGLAQAQAAGLLENDFTRSIVADALGIDLSGYEPPRSVGGVGPGSGF